jgi:hypothetical protein
VVTPRAIVLVLTGALGGCTLITDSFLINDFSGDPFPVSVETSSGAIIVGMRHGGDVDRVAVLDLLSPITVIDSMTGDAPQVTFDDLTLLGQRAPGQLDLPRARFPDAQLVALHPCENECAVDEADCEPNQCNVGAPGAKRLFDGIIGADVLAGDAVRLRLGDNQLFVLADVGGDDRGRTLSCDGVFSSPYRGGGTLVISGTELPFGNRRITLQACLGPNSDPDPSKMIPEGARGTDALLVATTGIGISMVNEATYARYRDGHPGAPALADLAQATVYMPSGLVAGRRAHVDALALVGAPISNSLAPCRQIYAHRLLTTYKLDETACTPDSNNQLPFDCPCDDNSTFCGVPAVLELTPPAGIDVLVIPDSDPTLQALRTELRPDQPEVDGLLGTDLLRAAEIDVDYPHDRLLARCRGDGCLTRPRLEQERDICQINSCVLGPGVASKDIPGCVDGPPLTPLTGPGT